MTNPPFDKSNSALWRRSFYALALLLLISACWARSDSPMDRALSIPKVPQKPPLQPPPPPSPKLLEAMRESSGALHSARMRGLEDISLRQSLGWPVGRSVYDSATQRVSPIQKLHTPAVFFAARQRVALAGYAADLVGHYPLPGGRAVSAKQKKRARRGRLKPGQLVLTYAKAGETVRVQLYDEDGRMNPDAYIKLSKLLYSPGDSYLGHNPWVAYHPRLFAMLYFTVQHFDKPVEVVSAFRVPRRRSKKSSNHWKGRAVDIKVSKVSRRKLLRYLDASFTHAGVGWYPRSSFVHLDTRGQSYYWTDFSGPGQRQRNRKRRPSKKARRGTDPTAKTVHLKPRDLYRGRVRRKRR